jgi:hypothetical protein
MRHFRSLSLALLALAPFAAAAPVEARLVSQRVAGVNRLCSYANPNYSERRRAPQLVRRIGAGEPCPVRYTPPPPVSPRVPIPAMATLTDERFENGQKICVYAYSGREYPYAMRAGFNCPYTPHFTRDR